MKHLYLTLLLCAALHLVADATQMIWTGAQNGNWSDPANWSVNGVSGIRIPGADDTVSFTYSSNPLAVHVDQSVAISAMYISAYVTLYASTPVTFTISKLLGIGAQATLKDSTSENVPFNMILNGATGAAATVNGNWVFEGRVSVNRLTAGATFTAEPGSQVSILSNFNYNIYTGTYGYGPGAQIVLKRNAGTIVSDKTSLRFYNTANFILDDNLDAMIPLATWSLDEIVPGIHGTTTLAYAAIIQIKNNIGKLAYPDAPALPKLVVDLPGFPQMRLSIYQIRPRSEEILIF